MPWFGQQSMTSQRDLSRSPTPDPFAVGFLENVRANDRKALGSYGEMITFEPGDALARQGLAQDTLFIVLTGKFVARRELPSAPGQPMTLGVVEPGETVGEMSILDEHTATATVTAETSGTAWRIDRKRFEQFLVAYPTGAPAVLRGLAVHITRRLRRTTRALVDSMDRLENRVS